MRNDALIAIRKASKLSKIEAAALIGASVRTWQAWENGARNMPPAKLQLFEMFVATLSA